MNVTGEWWWKNCIGCKLSDKGTVPVYGEYLTSVVEVNVSAPPYSYRQNNPSCDIYGEVSFNVGLSGDPVTLFSRDRDNPVHLELSSPDASLDLPLTDRHESDRALAAVSDSNRFYMNMRLLRKHASSQENDELIADYNNFEDYDPDCIKDICADFVVEPEPGFRFYVCYSVVFGARAEVEVRIKECRGSNRKIPIWGQIVAYQYLEEPSPNWTDGVSLTTLLNIPQSAAVTYSVDEPIELERKFVVVPVQYEKYLSVGLRLAIDNETRGVEQCVDFPIRVVRYRKQEAFMANENLTFTKEIKHVSGTVFSVSLKFAKQVPFFLAGPVARSMMMVEASISHIYYSLLCSSISL